jgi:hypothetical protein
MNSQRFVSVLYIIGLTVSLFGGASSLSRYLALTETIAQFDAQRELSKTREERSDADALAYYATQPHGKAMLEMRNSYEDSARFSMEMDRWSLIGAQRAAGDAAFFQGVAALVFGVLIVGARRAATNAR